MAPGRGLHSKLGAGFSSLKGCHRDLYIIFVVKVLESYNYFSLSSLFVLYLTDDFGVNDVAAGTLYGLWGMLLVLYGFVLGGAIDLLGVKKSLVLCFLLNISGRVVMASTRSLPVMLVALLLPNTAAGALGVPVMTIGVKRYTHAGNRGFAFSLFYSLMNIAALVQGLLLDMFRIRFKDGFRIASFGPEFVLNNGNRLFLASGCLTSLVGLVLCLAMQDATLAEEAGPGPGAGYTAVLPAPGCDEEGGAAPDPGTPAKLHTRPAPGLSAKLAEFVKSCRSVALSREFVKYIAMCIITVNLKAAFRYLDTMLPKYQLRAFGCGAPIGMIYAINPATIILLVPVVGALTTAYTHFDMIHFGSYLSALSPLWLVVWPRKAGAALFVLTLSLGEAVWSPRWYDYSMAVAPDGKEGVFTALASAPLFAAMLPTGMLSGYLLERYCPGSGTCDHTKEAEGLATGGSGLRALVRGFASPAAPGPDAATCRGGTMWSIVSALTLTSPILILLTQKWIRPETGPENEASAAARSPDAGALRGDCVDYNEADPLLLVGNVCQAAALPRSPTPPPSRV